MQNAIFLALAIAAEIVATSSLKTSYGFTRLWPSVLTVLAYGISFYLLSQTLKRMEMVKAISIALIVLGVIGLNAGDLLTGTNR